MPIPASPGAADESISRPSSDPVTVRPAQPGAGVPIPVRPPAGGKVVVAPRGRKVDTAYEVLRDIDSRREEMKATATV